MVWIIRKDDWGERPDEKEKERNFTSKCTESKYKVERERERERERESIERKNWEEKKEKEHRLPFNCWPCVCFLVFLHPPGLLWAHFPLRVKYKLHMFSWDDSRWFFLFSLPTFVLWITATMERRRKRNHMLYRSQSKWKESTRKKRQENQSHFQSWIEKFIQQSRMKKWSVRRWRRMVLITSHNLPTVQ